MHPLIVTLADRDIDRFAVWRRHAHPLIISLTTMLSVIVVAAMSMPEDSQNGIPGDLVVGVLAPSLTLLLVLIAGRSTTWGVLRIRLPFLAAAAWIVAPVALLIGLVIAEMRLTGHSFYLVDYLMRTADFPVWLAEQTATAVATPFVEEFVFRGVIQTELKKRIGRIAALVVTSTLFGFAHFEGTQNFSRIALLCCVGLVLGIVRDRTNSLGAPIAIHGIYNAAFSALEFIA